MAKQWWMVGVLVLAGCATAPANLLSMAARYTAHSDRTPRAYWQCASHGWTNAFPAAHPLDFDNRFRIVVGDQDRTDLVLDVVPASGGGSTVRLYARSGRLFSHERHLYKDGRALARGCL